MRKRSTNPRIPIHVTLKRSTIDKLDQHLKHNQSRSKFIDIAILQKLEAMENIDKISNDMMLIELLLRGVIKHELYTMLKESISEDA